MEPLDRSLNAAIQRRVLMTNGVAVAAPAAAAKRGMLAVIQQRRSYTMLHGPTHREFAYLPAKVVSVARDGTVKAVVLVDGRRVERRDWIQIEVDSRSLVRDVDDVLRQLVETEAGRPLSWPITFHDKAEALAAIKRAAGIAPEPASVPRIDALCEAVAKLDAIINDTL